MEDTLVTDFQNYHNWKPFVSEHNPEADEDQEPSLSGSVHHSSDPDEAVFDVPSQRSSPQTSPQHSDDEISVLLSESGYPYGDRHERQPSSPYTPLKTRSPFRKPSSVRAMQLETTPPPHLASPSSQQQQQRYKLTTPSRNGTPRSVRSQHSGMRSASRLSPTKKLKKEYPLVLLHVTLLPLALSYSPEVLESVLPGYMLENWKLLQEKATETVLERGILIPHPREDYDLLEERLMESLELKLPRILKCGHFHLEPDEEAELADLDADAFDDENDDVDICDDCGRRVRDGRFGSGTGSRRWDIKVYAANGLMRAGAWGAAWREMERVDVEILPWMEEDMKRELELRKENDERHLMERRPVQSEDKTRGGNSKGLDDARMREIYGEEAQAYVDGLVREEEAPLSPPPRKRHRERRRQQDVPLRTLLRNYIYLAAQDPRNVALGVLSMLILFLSLGSFGRPTHAPLPSYSIMPMPMPVAGAGDSMGNGPTSRAPITTAITPRMSVSDSRSAVVHDTSDLPPAKTQSSSDTFSASTQSVSDVPSTPMQDIGEFLTADAPDEILLEME